MGKTVILRNSTKIICGKVRMTRYGGITCYFTSTRNYQHDFYDRFKNYIPCMYNYDVRGKLWNYSRYSRFRKDSIVWVHPKARISRDLLRSSGYKITLDREKAEGIIIPELRQDAMREVKANIVAYDKVNNTTYLFELLHDIQTPITEYHVEKVKECILNKLGIGQDGVDFYVSKFLKYLESFLVNLIPPIEELFDLLENKDGVSEFSFKNIYKLDCDVPVMPAYEINIETLEMCTRMDSTLFEKFLIQCPWREYPVTLYYFIKNEFRNLKFSNNNNVRMVIDALHLDYTGLPDTDVVEPKDLNMLQDWIFHKLGIDNDSKAFISRDVVSNLCEDYRNLLRKRFAVSKISIDEPISCREMFELAKN